MLALTDVVSANTKLREYAERRGDTTRQDTGDSMLKSSGTAVDTKAARLGSLTEDDATEQDKPAVSKSK
jgi:hypothetical protein